ncbi:hypothetical protein GN958_ATG21521 [Phytophthora infestans]|uniref:Uncharacterized protein n=1 Tax=Phytophthora infestans TaxID=4787 RepID=A0A8S9TQR8_PHYIN|nr:hypothetical protein GN958_ATG21521 [Phytophthora infestans]
MTDAPSLKWTVAEPQTARKRPIITPTSDNYDNWTLEQIKNGITARKLSVRKRAKGQSEEETKRTKGCMFRILNILFYYSFFPSILETGHQLRMDEPDQGGSIFWIDVATAFSTDNGEMWKEVSSNFARAEAGSKISGHNSHYFWEFCNGRADAYYWDRWCEHRQSGREFCAANLYSDDEDDSTKESDGHKSKNENRKKRKGFQPDMVSAFKETVNELLKSESSKTQEDTWVEQELLLQEKRAAQKLVILKTILERNVAAIHELKQLREQYVQQEINADEREKALAVRTDRKLILEEQIDQLALDVLNRL